MKKIVKLPEGYSIERVRYIDHSLIILLDKDTTTKDRVEKIVPIRVIQDL